MSEELVQHSSTHTAAVLPDKKYFKIGEASNLLGVKPHVLRYWETEFPQIRPYKSRTGQRLYRHRDVEALQHIQKLLYEERYTIAGARQALRLMYENDSRPSDETMLSDEAIEAAVAVETPSLSPEPLSFEAKPVAAPSRLVTQIEKRDVLELVEEKMVFSQVSERLEIARAHLREMLLALEA